mgnify:CR=1 FL=1
MRKKGIPEVMVRAVISLHEGADTRVRVGLELSEEFEVKVGVCTRDPCHCCWFFAILVDVVMENVRNGLQCFQ